MSVVWAALGAIMGASVGMEGGGFIGAIAGMMAGIVEFAMLGAIFAVVGGRPEETVLGAVGGLLAGLAFNMMRVQAPLVLVANFGLVVGAIVGATLRPFFACSHCRSSFSADSFTDMCDCPPPPRGTMGASIISPSCRHFIAMHR